MRAEVSESYNNSESLYVGLDLHLHAIVISDALRDLGPPVCATLLPETQLKCVRVFIEREYGREASEGLAAARKRAREG